MSETSIGPAEPAPTRKTQATVEGVDAQNANEFDMEHGLAGAEAKPFSQPPAKGSRHAASSQPEKDPDRADPNERTDTINERRRPGLHGGGGDPGWKKP